MARSAEQLLERAMRKVGSGQLADARKLLAAVDADSLERPRSLLQLADAWLAADMYHKAAGAFRSLAARYRERRMWLEEVAVLKHMLRFVDDKQQLHTLIAGAYGRIGSGPEMERHYVLAIEEALRDEARDVERCTALFDEVRALDVKGNALSSALASLAVSLGLSHERSIELPRAPDSADRSSLTKEAGAALRANDLQRAYRALQEIVAMEPNDIEARESLADVMRWAGSHDGVVEQLRELIRIGQAHADARIELWGRELEALQARPDASGLRMITYAAEANVALAHDDIAGALRSLTGQEPPT